MTYRAKDYPTESNIIRQARNRCNNPNNHRYDAYGGRGIQFHEPWTFDEIMTEIGPRPSPDHSIDRIEGARGYEPGNIRWATAEEQARNRSDNLMFTIGDETLCLMEWAQRYNVAYNLVNQRVNRGWDIKRALTEGSNANVGRINLNGLAYLKDDIRTR